jgi:hypothetical protein
MAMNRLWILALCAISAANAAGTQEVTEEVVVVGRRDRAMDAFMRGDFVTAEKEFKDNFRCIRREEMLQDFSLEQGVTDAQRATTLGAPQNAIGDAGAPQVYNSPVLYNAPLRPEQIAERTCSSPEWQLYMIGLSQIQLGHLADAKKSLDRATQRSQDLLLFDADFRVGLLELLDGRIERAERRLKRLDRMRRTCDKRGMRCEVHADLDAAIAYLGKSIGDARRGQLRR